MFRWCAQQRATGNCAAKPMGGHRSPILLAERDWLLARLSVAPDLTIRRLLGELGERGVKVSYGALCCAPSMASPRDFSSQSQAAKLLN